MMQHPGARRIGRSMNIDRSDSSRNLRLQKALADAGCGARRDCEQMIHEGRVCVNGTRVERLPAFIDPRRDVVTLDGAAVDLARSAKLGRDQSPAGAVYLLVNKPRGVITTVGDPDGRRDVMSLVPRSIAMRERLFPVGRLDADSTGLLLLTNDGEFAHRLTHPSFGVVKEYRVLVRGLVADADLARLRKGMRLATPGARTGAAQRAAMESVRVVKRQIDRNRTDLSLLTIRLREGRNREIRRMLARLGLKVRALERVAIGPLRAPSLRPGRSKLLGREDVARLRAVTLESPRPGSAVGAPI
jgi:pseudouridine synthase